MLHLIFDTETTGLILHPAAKDELQPHIIEWGGLLVDEHGTELKELNVLINPGIPIPEEITKITGITQYDIDEQPTFRGVVDAIREMFAAADVLIAHNLPFDYRMMELDLARCGLLAGWPWPRIQLCTVQEHAEEWGRRPKLKELYEHYTGHPLAQTHRAIDDVRALKEVCIAAGVLR